MTNTNSQDYTIEEVTAQANAMIQQVRAQRDAYSDQAVNMAGELAFLKTRLENAQKELQALKEPAPAIEPETQAVA